VADMRRMFYNCEMINVFPDIYKWNFKNVTNINGMLNNCTLEDSLDDEFSKIDLGHISENNRDIYE